MKSQLNALILIFCFIFSNGILAQDLLTEGEIIIHFINKGNNTVSLTAEKIAPAKWNPFYVYPHGELILDEEFDVVTISAPGPYTRTYFDVEGDDDFGNLIALSFYKISILGKSPIFCLNTSHFVIPDLIDWLDIHLTFDYSDDVLYWGDCTVNPNICIDQVDNFSIIRPFSIQNTTGLDEYWINSLILIRELNIPVKLVWGPNPDQSNISKYYLYRKIDNQSFIKIGEFNNQTFDYKDKSILFTGDGSSTVSYKVTSFNGIESTPTNIASQQYDFEFDWSNGLMLTKNANHPKLVWVPNNTIQNLTGYKIYRKVDDEPFYYMGMVGTNTFTYTDGEVNLNVKESAIQYYVAATNGTQEDPTNTVTAIGDYNPHKENQQGEELSELKYFLSDNYPNPFNPTTTISFSIPERSFVTLKVYDMLGREVAELVNEELETGSFEKTFDANNLASGIYIYRITAMKDGKIFFNESRRMLLIK